MNIAKKLIFEQRMQALHDKYCQQLPEKYQEIENSWQQYQTNLTEPNFIETFYRLIHTLKGTAATFGFTTQADICFKIQKILLETKEDHNALSEKNIKIIQTTLEQLKANISAPAEEIS